MGAFPVQFTRCIFMQGIKVKDSATKKKAIALIEARKAAISAAMEED